MTEGALAGWLILALICVLSARRVYAELVTAIWGPIVEQRRARAAEDARLIADADYEHWHALFGDPDVATYGRHRPDAAPEAFRTWGDWYRANR